MVPADDQAIVLPCASVMVIMVLLKVAFTCATPEEMFLRSRRRTRVASLPIPVSLQGPADDGRAGTRRRSGGRLLPAGDRLRRTLAGARVGVGALAPHRPAAAMPQPAIAAEIGQPLDVELNLAPQVALDDVVAV